MAAFRRGDAAALDEWSPRAKAASPRAMFLRLVKGAPDGSEQATVGDLCKRLDLAQQQLTELVSRAAEAGLVAVSQSNLDGRVSEIRLSAEQGARRLADCFVRLEDERQAPRALAELDSPVSA